MNATLLLQTLVGTLGMAVFGLLAGLWFMGIDRVLAARMQARIGPPVRQPFIDLAKLLVDEALAARKPAQACIAVDNADPSAALLQSVQVDGATLFAHSACPAGDVLRIAVRDYMTDGSGSGKVAVQLDDQAARILDVERDGTVWLMLGTR